MNDFYQLWDSKTLTTNQLEIMLANYFFRTIQTVTRVCDVVRALIDPLLIIQSPLYRKAIINNLENLCDELGYGENQNPHILLLCEWINTLLHKAGSKNIPIEEHYTKFVTAETQEFVKIQKDLYNDESLLVVGGASFAQELFADYMMKQLNNGYVKNYQHLFKNKEEFNLTTKYFSVHLDEGTEENHALLIEEVIKLICNTPEDFEKVNYSYDCFERITSNFWRSIYNQLL